MSLLQKLRQLTVVAVFALTQGCTPAQLAAISKAIGVGLPSAAPLLDPSASKAGTITTVAGTGLAGESGDGGPAVKAQISGPIGLAFNSKDGSLYFVNYSDRWIRIREVDSDGNIMTLPQGEYENGTGEGTMPYLPHQLAFDPLGNLYACANNLVMKLEVGGSWTVVAGGAYNTPLPSEQPASFDIGDGKPATEAALFTPNSLAFDPFGNLYVSDPGHNRIRIVDREGAIRTFAGSGPFTKSPGDGLPATSVFLYEPSSIAVDVFGNLYVAEPRTQRIRKIDRNGIITTAAGNGEKGFSGDGGSATEARFDGPVGIAIDPFGNLYVADSGNHRIRRVDTKGIITTIAGTGTPNRDPNGHFVGDSGVSDGGPAMSARLANPEHIAVDNQGSVFLAETHSNRIRKISFQ